MERMERVMLMEGDGDGEEREGEGDGEGTVFVGRGVGCWGGVYVGQG